MATEILLSHRLRNGAVTLAREDGLLLRFGIEMDVNHSAEVIFQQLLLAMTDSEKSWIWPSEYEYSPERPEGGLRSGCTFRMTYEVPRFDKPDVPAKPVTYSYTLVQFRPDEHLYEYRSVDHPLQGGAVVQVIATGECRSRISWKGAYQQDENRDIVVRSLLQYVPFFFEKMEQRILAGPMRPECDGVDSATG